VPVKTQAGIILMSPYEETVRFKLQLCLSGAVPLIIQEYALGHRILNMDRPDLTEQIAAHGDSLMYLSKGATAKTFNALAEAVAIMAFCPDGVTFLGQCFEATPEQVEAAWAWADAYRQAGAEEETEEETTTSTGPTPAIPTKDTPEEKPPRVTSPSFEKVFRTNFSTLLQDNRGAAP